MCIYREHAVYNKCIHRTHIAKYSELFSSLLSSTYIHTYIYIYVYIYIYTYIHTYIRVYRSRVNKQRGDESLISNLTRIRRSMYILDLIPSLATGERIREIEGGFPPGVRPAREVAEKGDGWQPERG